MATIKALEGRTVHQIQSGQVIVDICSVVKELVENSLDAGSTSIDVRFKNNGLDSIEVQDNGIGISTVNYETVALKHYTSKLTNYDDLASLQTFGFRGEALSSLCALSRFHIVTAQADQAPKGTRLDFETSGKLKATSVVASQKGTSVTVEDLFLNLPVRRRELEKNIKREYGKVLGLLQAYACVSTETRILASNVMVKGRKAVIFATKSNSTTRENIANVFGTKALPMLVPVDLHFDLLPATSLISHKENTKVQIVGHVSRPVFGEGRNAPDRQMFFVNARPCTLPQVTKVFNEVYKSYNVSQSPFIFANIILDTSAYDVNVSPDKRTIMLHDQSNLLESLRVSLTELFDRQEQTVPQTQQTVSNLPASRQLLLRHDTTEQSGTEPTQEITNSSSAEEEEQQNGLGPNHLPDLPIPENALPETHSQNLAQLCVTSVNSVTEPSTVFGERLNGQQSKAKRDPVEVAVSPSNSGDSEKRSEDIASQQTPMTSLGVVPNAFERMRPRRQPSEVAIITIGSKTTSTVLGGSAISKRRIHSPSPPVPQITKLEGNNSSFPSQKVSQRMRAFAAPGSAFSKVSGSHQSRSHASRSQVDDTTEAEGELSEESPVSDSDEIEAVDDDDETAFANTDEANHLLRKSIQDDESDEYVDEEEERAKADSKVAELIRDAENTENVPDINRKRRAHQILKGRGAKDSTAELVQLINTSIQRISLQLGKLESTSQMTKLDFASVGTTADPERNLAPEDQLTLTISKDDFANMHVIGQFNLGFILATRAATDIFIIDQHASDEKYNFERLQSTTTVQNQRLVHPRRLELTAVDEEIILENNDALLKNGFLVEVDQSGLEPVGQRCKLLSLPMSKEVTFDTSDIEELIALLADSPPTALSAHIPRPSKVRRMFAMRACRSSIMIGKTLTMRQMQGLLRHMGEIDKPWNCPHGRPTMRHIRGLGDWTAWKEGDGLRGLGEQVDMVDWKGWAERVRASDNDEEGITGGIDESGVNEHVSDEEEEEDEDEEEDEEDEEERDLLDPDDEDVD